MADFTLFWATVLVAESVDIMGQRTILTKTVSREMNRQTTMTVAQDNRTATYVSLDKWPTLKKILRTEYLAKRTAPAPAGANAVSGSWLGVQYVIVPEEYRSVDLKENNGYFTRSNFRHGHYTARIGGGAAPVLGDGKNCLVATVQACDVRTRVETVRLGNKPVVERTYKLSNDGESMQTTVRDPSDGSVFTTTAHRKGEAH